MSDYTAAMRKCLDLARRGAGAVSPNPLVGSIVYSADGEELGHGWHERYGSAHAEVNAIENAISSRGPESLKGGTIVVNLEPCNHHGKTPPCSLKILDAGLARVVIGRSDPSDDAGGGATVLRENGLDVIEGVLADECYRLNEAFYLRIRESRPMVTVKIAQTLDGFVAHANGESKWISSIESRTRVHEMRAQTDVVLTGSGTARKDDPALTVRHVSGRQPVRMVLDSKGLLPPSLKLFSDDYVSHTIAVVGMEAEPAYDRQLEEEGGRLWRFDLVDGRLPLNEVLEYTASEGACGASFVNNVMVEAGPELVSSLLKADLVDKIDVFIAPKIYGAGIGSFGARTEDFDTGVIEFVEHEAQATGVDMLFTGLLRSTV